MPSETYPPPGTAPWPRLAYDNPNPEYGISRADWEERVFRHADHFNVARFTPTTGTFIATVKTFAEALYLALEDEAEGRKLIYVVGAHYDAFCMSPKDYPKFAELTLKMREERS